jgi:desulfoferrodoxin (superoxide reductase-like protein)
MLSSLALKESVRQSLLVFSTCLSFQTLLSPNADLMRKRSKKMQKGKAIRIASRGVVIAAALLIVLSSQPVVAHTPTSMTLEYDWDTQVLIVTISHTVANPNDHFIQNITVYKNDVKVDSMAYTSQGSATAASDTFNIAAIDGDVLRVWANCSVSGFIQDTITITEPSTTSTTTTDGTITPPPGLDPTVLILVTVVALGVIFLVIAIIRRR